MPEVRIAIGGREFDVACQEGEEHFLRTAASYLDTEAQVLLGQIGRLPPERMLLMAGLMLADKIAGMEDQLREAKASGGKPVAAREDADAGMAAAEVAEAKLADFAAKLEALADKVDTAAAG